MSAPGEAEFVVRRSLNRLLPLVVVSVAFVVGCGGGGGGSSTPGGGGGGTTHTATPTPQPSGPALNAIAAIVPNGLPNASVTAPPIPSASFATGLSSGPFVYSAAGKVTYGTGAPPLTVTDNDASGATCLVYEPAGASSATPCPFAASTSSVTLTNASDGYAVLYNGKFLAGGALTISAPGFSSLTVSITPTAIAIGSSVNFTSGKTPDGGIVYVSNGATSGNLFAAVSDPANPLWAVPYSSTTGYGTPAAVGVQTVNGVAASTLTGTGNGSSIEGGAHDLAVDAQGNVWFTENNARNSLQYVGVYVQHGSEANPNGGTVNAGPGAYVEYTLLPSDVSPRSLTSIIVVGNYVYTVDEQGEFWRIDTTNGNVNPNLGAAYTSTSPAPTNAAGELTDSSGLNSFYSTKNYVQISNLVLFNSSLWMTEQGGGNLVQITVDPSNPITTGICSPAGANPCIGTYQASTSTEQCPNGLYTDNVDFYVPDCFDNHVYEYSSTFAQSKSVATFTGFVNGGLKQTPDGWFWTAVTNGLAAVESMSSTTAGPATALNTACSNNNPNFRANGIIIGPDGTLLYSPSSHNNGNKAVVCGVVY